MNNRPLLTDLHDAIKNGQTNNTTREERQNQLNPLPTLEDLVKIRLKEIEMNNLIENFSQPTFSNSVSEEKSKNSSGRSEIFSLPPVVLPQTFHKNTNKKTKKQNLTLSSYNPKKNSKKAKQNTTYGGQQLTIFNFVTKQKLSRTLQKQSDLQSMIINIGHSKK